jgi:hypothetical protein
MQREHVAHNDALCVMANTRQAILTFCPFAALTFSGPRPCGLPDHSFPRAADMRTASLTVTVLVAVIVLGTGKMERCRSQRRLGTLHHAWLAKQIDKHRKRSKPQAKSLHAPTTTGSVRAFVHQSHLQSRMGPCVRA